MNTKQWNNLLDIVNRENEKLEAAMIVDSPWIPGYCDINTIDFFVRPDAWLAAHERVKSDFPDLLLLPDYWVEYGMALEPSGFGCKVDFYPNSPPTVHHIIKDVDDVDTIRSLEVPNPNKAGLMPMALRLHRYYADLLGQKGESIKIVSTRGPLTIASHLMGVTDLLLLTKLYPDVAHSLIEKTTQLCIDWLGAQIEAVGTAEGILLLDDVCGFFGNDDYLEFAHPYLKRIFDAFPDMLKLMHNDSESDVIYPHLADLNIDVYQPTYTRPISEVREKIDTRITILGTLSAMSLVNDGPDQVRQATNQMIDEYKKANGGSIKGLLVSTGGGAPMGAKKECIDALIKAVKEYNK